MGTSTAFTSTAPPEQDQLAEVVSADDMRRSVLPVAPGAISKSPVAALGHFNEQETTT
jgi:hypothetical protein